MYRVKFLAKADGLDYTNVTHKPASETLYPGNGDVTVSEPYFSICSCKKECE
jgi:hypothetical protein